MNSYTTLCWLIRGGFSSVTLRWSAIFLLVNTGSSCWLFFVPRSPSCLRTTSTDFLMFKCQRNPDGAVRWCLNWVFRMLEAIDSWVDEFLGIFYKELLLHYQSHVHSRYKRSLLRTIDRAKRLSSTQDFLSQECKNLKAIFLKLKYPEKFINSAINRLQHPKDPVQTLSDSPVLITLAFKHQKSVDVVRR